MLDKDKTSQWLESLTDAEIKFMTELEKKIRASYEIPDDGIADVILDGLITQCVLHYRYLRKGRYDKRSRHVANPLAEVMKTAKEMGWIRKADKDNNQSNKQFVNKWMNKLG
ncbi:hypothetical protein NIE88_14050 [Sporolactobacillus shoreicorticis]|uniref:Phage protein n=1 Tax=Sporolactobacillus shoreicorticis TaxID=1923877 RepID=A0ABW5S7C2_9BACL|nr:hypothetical protein [Sporolactobacillus shoreicorticis]MCO7126890.1 hypothetical protein [Sporolactobacillus shoreicorticis]